MTYHARSRDLSCHTPRDASHLISLLIIVTGLLEPLLQLRGGNALFSGHADRQPRGHLAASIEDFA